MLIIFILAVISAVLSTIDGAILSPASVLAQNLIPASVRTGMGEAWLSSLAIPFPTNTWITLIAVGTFFLVGRDRRDAALTC